MNDVTKDQLKDIRSDLTHLINMLDRLKDLGREHFKLPLKRL